MLDLIYLFQNFVKKSLHQILHNQCTIINCILLYLLYFEYRYFDHMNDHWLQSHAHQWHLYQPDYCWLLFVSIFVTIIAMRLCIDTGTLRNRNNAFFCRYCKRIGGMCMFIQLFDIERSIYTTKYVDAALALIQIIYYHTFNPY